MGSFDFVNLLEVLSRFLFLVFCGGVVVLLFLTWERLKLFSPLSLYTSLSPFFFVDFDQRGIQKIQCQDKIVNMCKVCGEAEQISGFFASDSFWS